MKPDSITQDALQSSDSIEALLETWLDRLLPSPETHPEPLHRAMRYAVFSGGKRLRPQILLHVALACGIKPSELELAMRAACAVELIHTASLVHDDLPCFDDAAERRGVPTVHVLFGEPMAVLVGDALLAQGFEILANAPRPVATRALRLVRLLVRATGSCSGLIGGQSLEQEGLLEASHLGMNASPLPEFIERYHSMKTGALFGMAAEAAAVAAGSSKTTEWARVGQLVGRGYLLARTEGSVKAQMQSVLALIRERVLVLSATPEPLLAFLDGLRDRALRMVSPSGLGPAAPRETNRLPCENPS